MRTVGRSRASTIGYDMTDQTLLPITTPPEPTSRRRQPAALAAGTYVASWLLGLVVFASSTDVRAPGAAVLHTYAGHEAVSTLQIVLTEGIPAVALAVVVLAFTRLVTRSIDRQLARAVRACGLAAAFVSLTQCLLGVHLTTRLVPAGRAGPVATLSETITRLDGVKMLLLAGLALAARSLIRRGRVRIPRWLAAVALALSVTISVTGIGYLLLLNGPASAAWLSLPLLLVWVGGVGLETARARTGHDQPANPSARTPAGHFVGPK